MQTSTSNLPVMGYVRSFSIGCVMISRGEIGIIATAAGTSTKTGGAYEALT